MSPRLRWEMSQAKPIVRKTNETPANANPTTYQMAVKRCSLRVPPPGAAAPPDRWPRPWKRRHECQAWRSSRTFILAQRRFRLARWVASRRQARPAAGRPAAGRRSSGGGRDGRHQRRVDGRGAERAERACWVRAPLLGRATGSALDTGRRAGCGPARRPTSRHIALSRRGASGEAEGEALWAEPIGDAAAEQQHAKTTHRPRVEHADEARPEADIVGRRRSRVGLDRAQDVFHAEANEELGLACRADPAPAERAERALDRGEVDVRGQVLATDRFEGIRVRSVPGVGAQGGASSGVVQGPCLVAVVDEQREAVLRPGRQVTGPVIETETDLCPLAICEPDLLVGEALLERRVRR